MFSFFVNSGRMVVLSRRTQTYDRIEMEDENENLFTCTRYHRCHNDHRADRTVFRRKEDAEKTG